MRRGMGRGIRLDAIGLLAALRLVAGCSSPRTRRPEQAPDTSTEASNGMEASSGPWRQEVLAAAEMGVHGAAEM